MALPNDHIRPMGDMLAEDTAHHFGYESQHPLIHVQDLISNPSWSYEPYVLSLYNLILCDVSHKGWGYGQSEYPMLSGAVVCMQPGQFVTPHPSKYERRFGVAISFHPDLIRGTALGRMIWQYRFFHYNFNRPLFLRDSERDQYIRVQERLRADLNAEGEMLNTVYIVRLLQEILDILQRNFRLQTHDYRQEADDVMMRYEMYLRDHILNGRGHTQGLPQIARIADDVKLTKNHFGDIYHDKLGMSAKQYMNCMLRQASKEWLLQYQSSAHVGRLVGFSDTPHFSRFFRNVTGMSPTDYIRQRKAFLQAQMEEFVGSEDLQQRLAALKVNPLRENIR